MTSGPCEAARESTDMGDEVPGNGAGDGDFEVFGKVSAAAEHHAKVR